MRIAIVTAVIVTAALGAPACKKKITAKECDDMVGRYVELPMKEKAPDAGPEAAYARRLLLEELADALDELPEEQRSVFVAHELDGRSFRELSAQWGVGVDEEDGVIGGEMGHWGVVAERVVRTHK